MCNLVYAKEDLPLMLSTSDVQRLFNCSRRWAITLMLKGEEEGGYRLARIGSGRNARYKVHRDMFLNYFETTK